MNVNMVDCMLGSVLCSMVSKVLNFVRKYFLVLFFSLFFCVFFLLFFLLLFFLSFLSLFTRLIIERQGAKVGANIYALSLIRVHYTVQNAPHAATAHDASRQPEHEQHEPGSTWALQASFPSSCSGQGEHL